MSNFPTLNKHLLADTSSALIDLSPSARLFLHQMCKSSNDYFVLDQLNFVYSKGLEWIAQKIGKSIQSVHRYIKEIKEAGYFTETRKGRAIQHTDGTFTNETSKYYINYKLLLKRRGEATERIKSVYKKNQRMECTVDYGFIGNDSWEQVPCWDLHSLPTETNYENNSIVDNTQESVDNMCKPCLNPVIDRPLISDSCYILDSSLKELNNNNKSDFLSPEKEQEQVSHDKPVQEETPKFDRSSFTDRTNSLLASISLIRARRRLDSDRGISDHLCNHSCQPNHDGNSGYPNESQGGVKKPRHDIKHHVDNQNPQPLQPQKKSDHPILEQRQVSKIEQIRRKIKNAFRPQRERENNTVCTGPQRQNQRDACNGTKVKDLLKNNLTNMTQCKYEVGMKYAKLLQNGELEFFSLEQCSSMSSKEISGLEYGHGFKHYNVIHNKKWLKDNGLKQAALSTCFLCVEHDQGKFFETALITDSGSDGMLLNVLERYATKKEAEEGHKRLLEEYNNEKRRITKAE